ncbi:MAG: TolC family protein [Acidobacteriaceae bacterium]|jgi:outer membrane protein
MRNPLELIAALSLLLGSAPLRAQQTELPDAPQLQAQVQSPAPSPPATNPTAPPLTGPPLTRRQAEQLALKNNPHITVAGLLALAQRQVVRETRSAEFPTLNGALTGVGAEEASRLSAGSLSASRLLNHVGAGVELNQLITDFGRTRNLVASSSLQARAFDQQTQATREDIALATDLAFYRALEAQATLQVAQSTVNARKAVSDQVGALTASKLKSTLDQSFAQVNLSQAQLLNLDAQSQFDTAIASLNEVLGTTGDTAYHLIDDPAPPAPVAPSAEAVITLALQQRPDLLALKLSHDADLRFARARHDQLLPTISGLGVVGGAPWAPNPAPTAYFPENWYGAAGVNVAIPIFNGFRYHSEATEADLRARASDEQSRALIDQIVRDVRTAWLTMNTAQQRMTVTAQLLQEANTALDLAGTRYRLGLSSIVELSQAQLQQTQAQIDDANARFEYEADLATLRFQSGSQP